MVIREASQPVERAVVSAWVVMVQTASRSEDLSPIASTTRLLVVAVSPVLVLIEQGRVHAKSQTIAAQSRGRW